jgi:two-component system, cell cycle response regulator
VQGIAVRRITPACKRLFSQSRSSWAGFNGLAAHRLNNNIPEARVASTHTVALIGFTAFERSTLEAFFRLAARRSPAYQYSARPERAQIVLVDADSADASCDARALPHRSIYVGARGRDGQLGHMLRPINMMSLLKLLDGCLPRVDSAPAVEVARASASAGPSSQLPVSRADHILVVDDSDIALRFMAGCLGRFGFEVQLARSGEEALQRVAQAHFAFVFMDVTMPGIDGYQTCKLIKKRPYPNGRRAPDVVMLTSRGGMVDKMRGTLAGCDAYLTKPLQHDGLMRVIGSRITPAAATA